ncbi:MAG: hypothetical protein WA946_10075 [Nitrospirota bacterium]
MSNTPLTASLSNEHRKPGWGGHWLALLHSDKFIEASDDNSIVINHDCTALLNHVLVSTALEL